MLTPITLFLCSYCEVLLWIYQFQRNRADSVFNGLDNFPDNVNNVTEIPDHQDGYRLMLSEFLGNDSVPTELNALHNDMGLHDGQVMELYRSLILKKTAPCRFGALFVIFFFWLSQNPSSSYSLKFSFASLIATSVEFLPSLSPCSNEHLTGHYRGFLVMMIQYTCPWEKYQQVCENFSLINFDKISYEYCTCIRTDEL